MDGIHMINPKNRLPIEVRIILVFLTKCVRHLVKKSKDGYPKGTYDKKIATIIANTHLNA